MKVTLDLVDDWLGKGFDSTDGFDWFVSLDGLDWNSLNSLNGLDWKGLDGLGFDSLEGLWNVVELLDVLDLWNDLLGNVVDLLGDMVNLWSNIGFMETLSIGTGSDGVDGFGQWSDVLVDLSLWNNGFPNGLDDVLLDVGVQVGWLIFSFLVFWFSWCGWGVRLGSAQTG